MKIKRVLLHSAPPWAPSGYGLQCRYLAQALRELGYDVAISVFGGCHETRTWNGYKILSCGVKSYGNGVIAGNYRAHRADLLITLGDLFVLEPSGLRGLNFMPIVPVDCTPLSVMDKSRLDALRGPLLHPVAMSEFGRAQLAAAGYEAPVLPHCTKFRPDPAAGVQWRKEQRVPPAVFLISKVGVNNEDDRKAFSVTLQAFAEFARDRDDVGLYLHCEPQAAKSPNLAYMAIDLGIAGKGGSKVVFADEWRRGVDGYGQEWMHGLYCATDVYDGVSKGEGFGVPVIEALACGTPVIVADNSAMPEKLHSDGASIMIGGQPEWAKHHHAWWQTPSVTDLVMAYQDAYEHRGQPIEPVTAWSFDAMKARLRDILADLEAEASNDHVRAFGEIYAQDVWGGDSGPGSDPDQAREYVAMVSAYIREHDIGSVLDLGCGDGRIARAIDLAGASYVGIDIMSGNPTGSASGQDIRICDLPAAELVLIKDVFQHWPNADIIAMRHRLEAFPHVLITNTLAEVVNGTPANTDIPAGHWRGVDLAADPFRWPVAELLRWQRNGEVKTTVRLGTTAQLAQTAASQSACSSWPRRSDARPRLSATPRSARPSPLKARGSFSRRSVAAAARSSLDRLRRRP